MKPFGYVSVEELERRLEIKEAQRKRLQAQGAPKYQPGRGFHLDEWIDFLLSLPYRGRASKARSAAEKLNRLRNRRGKQAPQSKEETPTEPEITTVKSTETKRSATDHGAGIEAGVNRLREAEVDLHLEWVQAIARNDKNAQSAFRNWQDSLDLLSKAEVSLVKYRKEVGELTETSSFTSWVKQRIEAAKSILLDLPNRVAPQCEGLPWHQVQKLLESEVRRALAKLAETK